MRAAAGPRHARPGRRCCGPPRRTATGTVRCGSRSGQRRALRALGTSSAGHQPEPLPSCRSRSWRSAQCSQRSEGARAAARTAKGVCAAVHMANGGCAAPYVCRETERASVDTASERTLARASVEQCKCGGEAQPAGKDRRDDDGRASAGGATPARTELIEENKRMLKALSQRYPGQLELRAPLGRGHASK